MTTAGQAKSATRDGVTLRYIDTGAGTAYATEDDIRTRYPGLGVITVPAAHFVQMEQPAATNNIISDFLDKLE